MFQPLLLGVFRGILDGEVSFTKSCFPDLDSFCIQLVYMCLFICVCVCVYVSVCVQTYPVAMSTYLGIMGRVLLQNSSFFSSLLTQMASECSQKVSPVVSVFSAQFL